MFCMLTIKCHFLCMFLNLCTFSTQFKSLKRGNDWFLLARDFLLVHISFTNFHRIRFHSTNSCFERSAGLDFSAFNTPFFVHRKGSSHCISTLPDAWRDVCQLRNSSIQYLWRMTTQSRTVQSLVRSGYVFKSVAVIVPFSISFVS